MDQAVPSTTFVNDRNIKRQKLEETTNNNINRLLITHFEDLSNELIYQIFELLDSYDVYIIFSNLNLRIENLRTNSNLRINLDLSSISKSNFQHYYKEIIIPHQLRINSIRLTNLFIYNHPFSPLRRLTSLCQLEKLIIHNIQMHYLEELLISLRVLPKLYSLDIEPIDNITNPSHIYDRIFRLPVLKYCQISFKIKPNAILLLETTNEYSSIEHLIIRNDISFHHLDILLSFIPHLRYLSCLNIFRLKDNPTNIRPIILNKLSHILFQMRHTTFDQFKQWITNLSHRIEVLCISTKYDMKYLDANQWEQLIINHIPYLRIFDIQYTYTVHKDNQIMACNSAEIEQFNSSFWIERQWSFEHLHGWIKNWDNRIFYSTNPYRRKYFTLYGETGQLEKKIHLNTVLHVHIRSLQAIINCIYYFPRVTKITFEHIFDISPDSIATSLNCIIPLKQITKLVVNCHCFSFEQIIQILCLTSNLCIMILKSIYLSIPDYWSLQQNENFQKVSKTNQITNITIEEKCKLIDTRLLVALCPRLEHLTIHIPTDVFQLTIRFLLSKTNENIRRLFSLCLTHESKSLVETLKTFIESEKLLDNYFLEFFEDKLYLYW